MVDQGVARRVSRPVRLVGVLALLLGIAAMHAGVFVAQPIAVHAVPDHTSMMASVADSIEGLASADHHQVGHGAMHACVFILSAAAFSIGLVLLRGAGFEHGDSHPRTTRLRRVRQARPPPWTVHSLAELSILRI